MPLDPALEYVSQNLENWDLESSDVEELSLIRQYTSRHNQVTHLYFSQRYRSIPVYNAILGIHLDREGQVLFATPRLNARLQERINALSPKLSAPAAIEQAARHLELESGQSLTLIRTEGKTAYLYEGGALSGRPIRAELIYFPAAGTLRLAWNLTIDPPATADVWDLQVDALTGDVLSQYNHTVYCVAGNLSVPHQHADAWCPEDNADFPYLQPQVLFSSSPSYRVFPLPAENPSGNERQLLSDPADMTASPFGWHDVDGVVGPEYLTTRGNNTFTFFDLDSDDMPDGDEPQVGETMTFDFPFDPLAEPEDNRNAGLTQLFYTINRMHDLAYRYGFDEESGNFQQNNYGQEGQEGDPVIGQALNGGWRNNASFSTSPDGLPGTMRMYLWEITRGPWLSVQNPEPLAASFQISLANFGPRLSYTGVAGRIVDAVANGSDPGQGCGPITNATEVAGNIAMIDRGGCYFEEKVGNAADAGAVAVIICNYDQSLIEMAGLNDIEDPQIPAVMLGADDCRRIRNFLDRGVQATLRFPPQLRPRRLDGSFDNGIVAHEYAHGISIRLTGSADRNGCLINDEQMGEGWSDFFTLVTTSRPGDTGREPRGVGHYVLRTPNRQASLRTLPYSTDFNINDLTYEDVIGTGSPYSTGEVWTAVLWDLYWRLAEEYGYSEDLLNGEGGNNMALQLVVDALKLQACNPGFLDGRDAILMADQINNQGVNRCLIWEVFARRGLGYGASQGDPNYRHDALASFEPFPTCIQELKITKAMTPTILPGETITVTLTITNHKAETAPGVVIVDELPEGTDFVAGSVTGPVELEAEARQLTFSAGDLSPGEELTITYKLNTDPRYFSVRQFLDDVENIGENWNAENFTGLIRWRINRNNPYSGQLSWWIPNALSRNDQGLSLAAPLLVSGQQPVLRFWHQYDIQAGLDGGIVELTTDDGATWTPLPAESFLRNGYAGRIAQETLGAPKLRAFWGNSNEYIDSYIDLSPYRGEEIRLRFRYASLENSSIDTTAGTGWYVDNIELMDMVNFQSEACVFSEEGDEACSFAANLGTVAESASLTTSTSTGSKASMQVALFPNPATSMVNVALRIPTPAEDLTIELFNASGQRLQGLSTTIPGPEEVIIPLQTRGLSPGLYFVKISGPEMTVVEKVVVK